MKILIADDERVQRETLSAILADHAHETRICCNVAEAVATLQSESFDLVLTDFKMPDGTGIDVATKARQLSPDAGVFIMTAFADVSSVIEAMRVGVVDYLLKPLNVDHLLRKIRLVEDNRTLLNEVRSLRALVNPVEKSMLIGESDAIKNVRATITQVARTKGTILITGESGTGKEVAARLIHASSSEAGKRFVAVNCAAIPENLLESEFFGHKKGAFTGAVSDKEGLFKAASGGTIFLDEIGELPKALQAKLLRVLQEREITAVGDTKSVKIDVRLIAATNRDIAADVASGLFRQDLFYRINVVEIRMPALREHPEDIPVLAQHFIDKYAREFARKSLRLGNSAARRLMEYKWPGNIRELENVMERAIILGTNGATIEVENLPENFRTMRDSERDFDESPSARMSLDAAVNGFIKRHIEKVLDAASNDKKEAAKLLGLGLSSLYRKMDDLGIVRRNHDQSR
jgi:two-component system response regulator PilR (NtrC family)